MLSAVCLVWVAVEYARSYRRPGLYASQTQVNSHKQTNQRGTPKATAPHHVHASRALKIVTINVDR